MGELRTRVSLGLHLEMVKTTNVLSVVPKRVGVYEDGEDEVTDFDGAKRWRIILTFEIFDERERERRDDVQNTIGNNIESGLEK